MTTYEALRHVETERQFQNTKWGGIEGAWPIPDGVKLAVLLEEVGEVANALLEGKREIDLRHELIQVAAVATRWAETLGASEKPIGFAEGDKLA